MTLPTPLENLPPELADQMRADAGRGVSTRPEDQIIPILSILQTGSPECDKRGSDYIDGAEPGHFHLRGAINPIRNGTEGIDVIPCGMIRTWVEWRPARQGFVERHTKPPLDLETRLVKDGGYEREALVRSSNGNTVADTRELYLLSEGMQYMLPCTSTKHTFARTWQTYCNQIRDPRTKVVLPSFARHYRLRTVSTANAKGKWFGLKFDDLGWVPVDEYHAARAFNDIIERGALRVELPLNEGAENTVRVLPQAPAA